MHLYKIHTKLLISSTMLLPTRNIYVDLHKISCTHLSDHSHISICKTNKDSAESAADMF